MRNMNKMFNYIKLIRPKHYIKNFLIFVPLFFSRELFTVKLYYTVLGYITFCFLASAVYVFNDLKDVEKDKLHPIKCKRPIAVGSVSKAEAVVLGMILILLSFIILAYYIRSNRAIFLVALYLLINIMYSLKLKNYPIVDISVLALGFLIRIMYGGVISDVVVSSWLYLTVIAFSFYFGLGKRRNELRKINSNETRAVMVYYNDSFLNNHMYMCLGLGLGFYALWTVERGGLFLWSVPIAMIICMVYNLDLENSDGDPVTVLIGSKSLLILVVVYILFMFVCVYR